MIFIEGVREYVMWLVGGGRVGCLCMSEYVCAVVCLVMAMLRAPASATN